MYCQSALTGSSTVVHCPIKISCRVGAYRVCGHVVAIHEPSPTRMGRTTASPDDKARRGLPCPSIELDIQLIVRFTWSIFRPKLRILRSTVSLRDILQPWLWRQLGCFFLWYHSYVYRGVEFVAVPYDFAVTVGNGSSYGTVYRTV